jgi:predicted metal-dependent phosphoesterase TrpH
LADHDTLRGVAEAVAEGERRGVRVIPATELNTESEWGDVHVLAYFVDPQDAALEERLRWLRENRGRRIELMVEKLNALGYAVSLDRVREIAQGGSTLASLARTGALPLGRPHLAQALFEAGHVPTYDSAFDTLISKESPAYVSRVGLAPLEAGVARAQTWRRPIARASRHGRRPRAFAAPAGRARPRRNGVLLRLTHTRVHRVVPPSMRRYGLVPTGGSDFHGRGEHGTDLGGVFVPQECIGALESRRGGN